MSPRSCHVLLRDALLLLILVSCGKEKMDLIHDVAANIKAKPRVEVTVKLNQDEATAADVALQKSLEDAVERQNVGRLVNSGTRPGQIFVTVEVEQTADAIEKLRKILLNAGVLDRANFRVIQGS